MCHFVSENIDPDPVANEITGKTVHNLVGNMET